MSGSTFCNDLSKQQLDCIGSELRTETEAEREVSTCIGPAALQRISGCLFLMVPMDALDLGRNGPQ